MDLLKKTEPTGIFYEPIEVTLVFPVYNEAEAIRPAVLTTATALNRITPRFEIIIAEDGSTDGTDKIASAISLEHNFVRNLHSPTRLGKGAALNNAIKAAKGGILIFMDVDLSTSLFFLDSLITAIKQGNDLAIGSRMFKESVVDRSLARKTVSQVYNLLVRFLLKTKINDHQCGFKAFNRHSLLKIIDKIRSKNWFWDTEIIALASYFGLSIKEIPVTWKKRESSKVKVLPASFKMGFQVIMLWWRLKIKRKP